MRALVPAAFCMALGASVGLLIDRDQALRWDNLVHNLPLTLEAFRQLSTGRLPAWNPYLWSGSPLLADPQSQTFYPPMWLAHVLAGGHPAAALPLLYAIHVTIAAGGTYVFARALGATVSGALLAASVFALNPFTAFLATSFANELAVLAWLPWTAWAVLRATEGEQRSSALAAGALAVALAWAAGYPQLWVYSLAAVAALVCGCSARPGRALGLALLAGIVGLALSLYQVLPFLSLWQASQRAELRPLDEFLRTDVPLTSWPAIALPGLFGSVAQSIPLAENNWPHLGLCAVTLALVALLRPTRARLTLFGVGALALWLASGSSGGLLPLLYTWVPGLGFLRGPYKFYPYATFAIAMLAGLGLSDVQHAPATRHTLLLALAAVLGLLGIGLRPDTPAYVLEAAGALPVQAAVIGIGGTAVLAILVQRAATSPRGAPTHVGMFALLVAVATFVPELAVYSRPTSLARPLLPLSTTFLDVRRALAPEGRWHWGIDILSTPKQPDLRRALGAYWQIEMSTGYSAFLDTGYARAIGQDASTAPILGENAPDVLEGSNRVLDVLATPYVLARAEESTLRWLTRRRRGGGGPSYSAAMPIDELRLLIRGRSLPRLRSVRRVEEVATRDDAIRAVQLGSIDPASVALVERSSELGRERGACTIDDTVRDRDRIETTVRCHGDGFVVLAERWDRGWSATIDGAAAPIVRTYGLVLGVAVPPGKHRLVVRYAPPGVRAGAFAAAATAVLLAAVVLRERLRGPAGRV